MESNGTGRWVEAYWAEIADSPSGGERQAGRIGPGELLLPPPVEDLAFAQGVWQELNEKLGLLIDMAEEEDVPVAKLDDAARILRASCDRIRQSGREKLRCVAARRLTPPVVEVIAELPAAEFVAHLEALADFLEEAKALGKDVTILL